MLLPLLLILLSSLNILVSGLLSSDSVEGFISLDGVDFYYPSESELNHLERTHAEAVHGQASYRPKPPQEIASHGIHRRVLTQHELATAQKLVKNAATEQSAYNEWVINNPRQNNYCE
jgi:hypothetical protein